MNVLDVMNIYIVVNLIMFGHVFDVFSEPIAIWTETEKQIVNGVIVREETWIIKRWYR